MKIAFILRHFFKHGDSRYAYEISKELSKKHEIHVFANKWDFLPRINFHFLPTYFENSFILRESLLTLSASLLVRKKEFDIVYSQPGRYFVPDIAGVHICTKVARSRRTLANDTLILAEKFVLKKCKRIIAVSNKVKKELVNYYSVPENKIEVIYNGVNLKEFSPKNRKYKKEIRKEFRIDNNTIILLYVGDLFKGAEFAIKALPYLKREDVKLLLVGKDNEQEYINLVKKLNLEDKVIFVGFRKDVHKFYGASDIFVYPTRYDSFGMVILEAMASGLAVITNTNAGASELIINGKNGLILNSLDPKEMAEKIKLLLKDKNLRKKLGANAYRTACNNTWKKVAERYEEVFDEVRRK